MAIEAGEGTAAGGGAAVAVAEALVCEAKADISTAAGALAAATGRAEKPNHAGSMLVVDVVAGVSAGTGVARVAAPDALASLSATEAANWAKSDCAPVAGLVAAALAPTESVMVGAGAPLPARPASCRSVPTPVRPVATSGLGPVAPNRAWTAVSPRPWARAKSARVAISGRGASVVMTLILLPSGTTCKPAAGGAALARACRSSLSIWPFKTPANSLLWGLESVPAPALGSSPPLGAAVGAVKKFIVGSMKSSS